MLNSLRYKDLLQDVVLAERDPAKLEAKYETSLTPAQLAELKQGLGQISASSCWRKQRLHDLRHHRGRRANSSSPTTPTCSERVENAGHRFGENLSDRREAGADRLPGDAVSLRRTDMLKRLVLAVIVLVHRGGAAAAGWWAWPREETQAAERRTSPSRRWSTRG